MIRMIIISAFALTALYSIPHFMDSDTMIQFTQMTMTRYNF